MELRNKLRDIGYRVFPDIFNFPCLSCSKGLALPSNGNNRDGGYDCGTNEDLFLALAALRDDTDNNQWFTNGKDWALYRDGSSGGIPGFDFFNFPADMDIYNLHKASVNEIVEHFKEK